MGRASHRGEQPGGATPRGSRLFGKSRPRQDYPATGSRGAGAGGEVGRVVVLIKKRGTVSLKLPLGQAQPPGGREGAGPGVQRTDFLVEKIKGIPLAGFESDEEAELKEKKIAENSVLLSILN